MSTLPSTEDMVARLVETEWPLHRALGMTATETFVIIAVHLNRRHPDLRATELFEITSKFADWMEKSLK